MDFEGRRTSRAVSVGCSLPAGTCAEGAVAFARFHAHAALRTGVGAWRDRRRGGLVRFGLPGGRSGRAPAPDRRRRAERPAPGDPRLAEAAQGRDRDAVRALLAGGHDVDAPQADGATALAWAAHRDDAAMADLLLEAGADPNAANDLGVTPLMLAGENGSAPDGRAAAAGGGRPEPRPARRRHRPHDRLAFGERRGGPAADRRGCRRRRRGRRGADGPDVGGGGGTCRRGDGAGRIMGRIFDESTMRARVW